MDKGLMIKELAEKIGVTEDVVIFAKYGGTELKVDGTGYLIVREADILAVKN